MDDGEAVTIASAVVVPEHDDAMPSGSPERSKRRWPGGAAVEAEAPKRQRLSDAGVGGGEAGEGEPDTRENRRQKRMEEEKKRGKRLFGALLGTIGQFQKETTTRGARAAQVKRKEAEAKLQEKMKAQTEEIDERRKREDDVVNLRRRVESRDFEERAMHIRHANLLAQANVLATRTTPKLFYLPWKLLPSDEEAIRSQIEAAEETTRTQEDAFRKLREQDEIDMQAAGGLDTVADNLDPTIDQPDISIHTPPPHDDIAEELHDGELGAQTDGHGESADRNPVATHEERRDSDIGDPVDITDDGGEDTVIY